MFSTSVFENTFEDVSKNAVQRSRKLAFFQVSSSRGKALGHNNVGLAPGLQCVGDQKKIDIRNPESRSIDRSMGRSGGRSIDRSIDRSKKSRVSIV